MSKKQKKSKYDMDKKGMTIYFALGSTSLIHTQILTVAGAMDRLSSFWYVGDKSYEELKEYVETGNFPVKGKRPTIEQADHSLCQDVEDAFLDESDSDVDSDLN